MKTQNTPQRTDVTTLPILPGTILITTCVLLAFLLLMAVLYSTQILAPPAFLQGIFTPEDENTPDDGFSAEFIASLSGYAPLNDSENGKFLNMSTEALRDLLLNVTPIDSYYHFATVTWEEGNNRFTTSQVYYLISDGKIHAQSLMADGMPKQIIVNADTFYIQEGLSSRRFARTTDSSFTPESELGLPSLSRMQKMIEEAEIGKYQLALETVLDSPCIRVSFTDTVSGVREVFDVMPDYGIIVTAYSYLPDGQSPYYIMQTNAILTDISGFGEEIFEIPAS